MSNKELRSIWEERISDYKNSGLSMKKWCDKNSLKLHQLQYWIRKYKNQEAVNSTSTKWVKVDEEPKVNSHKNDHLIQLRLNDYTIDVHPGFDSQTLKEVIQVLSSL
ncbi:IS66 family insertion sequence element accessory protein TnpA [Haloplasma contractile]|uniref:Transposase orf1 for insertion sequence element protein n=1 Tax=Haloplasma contractile SSD-17B TaxID=1033810 RepID=F7PSI7_9MOLU|nr:hypothetical protein [Haloplasma contractile]ERJ12623.1 transposase orf1 for insertion sequence element protein [Haloplasma contractile SSD-17B]